MCCLLEGQQSQLTLQSKITHQHVYIASGIYINYNAKDLYNSEGSVIPYISDIQTH